MVVNGLTMKLPKKLKKVSPTILQALPMQFATTALLYAAINELDKNIIKKNKIR